jgi:hypothetical protein
VAFSSSESVLEELFGTMSSGGEQGREKEEVQRSWLM